jgi:hypothetical protein
MNKIFNNEVVLSLTYKLSTIFVVFYIVTFNLDFSIKEQLVYSILTIFIVFGIGGIGYLINDFTDLQQDKLTQKRNIFLLFNKYQIATITACCIGFALLPWLVFPFTFFSLIFLMSEILLFIVYSCRPFRFKEKGILGLLTDALYAHLIPVVFAIYTFTLIKQPHLDVQLFFLPGFFWIFLFGFRNILKHQIEDVHHDKISKTNTLIQGRDIAKMKNFAIYLLIPLELIFFVFTIIAASPLYLNILGIYLTYIFLYVFKRRKELTINGKIQQSALFNFLNERILNEFYERWLGILILLIMIIASQNYFLLVLLTFHLLLFHRVILAK